MNLDIIQSFLAKIFDKFKAQSPVTFLVIQFILGIVNFGLANGIEIGLFSETNLLSQIMQVVGYVLAAIIGPKTFNFLKENWNKPN